jgi:hypothetical protein
MRGRGLLSLAAPLALAIVVASSAGPVGSSLPPWRRSREGGPSPLSRRGGAFGAGGKEGEGEGDGASLPAAQARAGSVWRRREGGPLSRRGGADEGEGRAVPAASKPDSVQVLKGDDSVDRVELLRQRPLVAQALMWLAFGALIAASLRLCSQTAGQPYLEAVNALLEGKKERLIELTEEEMAGLPSPLLPGFFSLLSLALSTLATALFALLQRWSVRFRSAVEYRHVAMIQDAHAVMVSSAPLAKSCEPCESLPWSTLSAVFPQVIPKGHRGGRQILPLRYEEGREGRARTRVPYFVFQHRVYVHTRAGFRPRSPSCSLPLSRYQRPPVYGTALTGRGRAAGALRDYGANRLDVEVPSRQSLLVEEMLSPMSVLKAVDLVLFAATGAATAQLVMDLLWFVSTRLQCVFRARANLLTLRDEVVKGGEGSVAVYRGGGWEAVALHEVVPGDVMAWGAGDVSASANVPADCLLLHGEAIVDEAILTGESMAVGGRLSCLVGFAP